MCEVSFISMRIEWFTLDRKRVIHICCTNTIPDVDPHLSTPIQYRKLMRIEPETLGYLNKMASWTVPELELQWSGNRSIFISEPSLRIFWGGIALPKLSSVRPEAYWKTSRQIRLLLWSCVFRQRTAALCKGDIQHIFDSDAGKVCMVKPWKRKARIQK